MQEEEHHESSTTKTKIILLYNNKSLKAIDYHGDKISQNSAQICCLLLETQMSL